MEGNFLSYAFQDLPLKKIKKYATQYDGVDLTVHLGANDNNFPFLVKTYDANYAVMLWNAYLGMMAHLDEDPVRDYATVQYLKDNAYPVFDSLDAAQQWAIDHDWPRKKLDE